MHTSHVSIKEWGAQARQDQTRMKRKTEKTRAISAGLDDYADDAHLEEEVQAEICYAAGECTCLR